MSWEKKALYKFGKFAFWDINIPLKIMVKLGKKGKKKLDEDEKSSARTNGKSSIDRKPSIDTSEVSEEQ